MPGTGTSEAIHALFVCTTAREGLTAAVRRANQWWHHERDIHDSVVTLYITVVPRVPN